MKAARIKITPKIMARLQAGKTAVFRIPEPTREVRITAVEHGDFPSFGGIFGRILGNLFKNW